MKKVFSNAEQTIHVWAQQTQSEGRSKNCYFEGETVYSYGSHYPLGTFVKNGKGETAVIINTSGYSQTTASHIRAARFATNHYVNQFSLASNNVMTEIIYSKGNKKALQKILNEAIIRRLERYESELIADTKTRRAVTLEKWKNDAVAACNTCIEILTFIGTKPNAEANKRMATVAGVTPAEAKEYAIRAAASAARRRAIAEKKRIAERAVKRVEAVQSWLAGEYVDRNYLHDHDTILLRIMGENIQTSHGAEFPITHGLKAFEMIRNCRAEGKEWQRNGHTIQLGEFQIDRIEPDGKVIAGCHTVPYSEIERIANQLGV